MKISRRSDPKKYAHKISKMDALLPKLLSGEIRMPSEITPGGKKLTEHNLPNQ
jgi:hypothetical protein